MKITLTAKDFEKENDTFSGQLIDFLAVAASWWEWNECYEQNIPYIDEAMEMAFNEIDHESAYIEHLNIQGKPVDGLKYGAWYALNMPSDFLDELNKWTDERREEVNEYIGDYSHMQEPYATELQNSFKWHEEQLRNEWLNGDRSNLGLLHNVQKDLFGTYAPIEYDETTDTITAEISIEDAENELGVQKPTTKKVKSAYIDYFVRMFNSERERQHVKAEKQRKEREETMVYQQERQEEEDQKRIARLKSMTA